MLKKCVCLQQKCCYVHRSTYTFKTYFQCVQMREMRLKISDELQVSVHKIQSVREVTVFFFTSAAAAKPQPQPTEDKMTQLQVLTHICLFVNNSAVSYLLLPQMTTYKNYTCTESSKNLYHSDMHCSLSIWLESTNQHISTHVTANIYFSLYISCMQR